MTPSEKFKSAVQGRKAGRTCQVEHPEWTPMDDVTVKSFIPNGLRKVYWMSNRGKNTQAYIAARELLPRINYEPWLWRLPEKIRISMDETMSTLELIEIAEASAKRLPISL